MNNKQTYLRPNACSTLDSEEELYITSKPTQTTLTDTVDLLKDFKIKIKLEDIPDFKTIGELYRWRKKKIKEKLMKL